MNFKYTAKLRMSKIMNPQVYKLTENYTTTRASSIAMNIIQHATLEMLHDVAVFSTDYKNQCTSCSLTVAQLAVVS